AGQAKAQQDRGVSGGYANYHDDITKEAYQAGKDKANSERNISGGGAGDYTNTNDDISKQAYQAGKDKANAERGTLSGTTSSPSNSNTNYLAAGGAAIAGAGAAAAGYVSSALGGNNSKQQDVEDSLLEDAEKVDPNISKLPAHKVNEKELKHEETFGPGATLAEKHTVYKNEDKEWEREASAYNKSHGLSNPEESLVGEAEEVDPKIKSLPPHKVNEKELKHEETFGPGATLAEKETVYRNTEKEWARDTADYNKRHGFIDPKESLVDEAEAAKTRDASSSLPSGGTTTAKDSSTNPGYLAAGGAALAGAAGAAVGYVSSAFGSKNPKQEDVDDSLIEDAEKVDPSIAKLPPHKVNEKELKKEETLAPDAPQFVQEYVESNQEKEWERETDAYNKAHGFANPKESLLDEAEDVDPKIKSLPAHKTNTKELKKEETLPSNASPVVQDFVESNQEREWERDTAAYNKKHGFTNPTESLIAEAEDVDPKIKSLPPHKVDGKALKREETLNPDAPPAVQELVENNQEKELERETEEYNIKHGFINPKGSLLEEAEAVDPKIRSLPAHKVTADTYDAEPSANAGADVQKLPPNAPTARHEEVKEALAGNGNSRGISGTTTAAAAATVGAAGAVGAGVGAALSSGSKKDHHDAKLDPTLKKDLYDQGYSKGKTSGSLNPQPHHERQISGASFNTTKPFEGDLPEPDVDVGTKSSSKASDKGLDAATLAAATGAGIGAAAVATSASGANNNHHQSLDPSLKKEAYDAGHKQGSAVSAPEFQQRGILGTPTLAGATGAGVGAGAATGTGLSHNGLDNDLKKEAYEAGHKHGSSQNNTLGTPTLAAATGAGVGAATDSHLSSNKPKSLDSDLKREAYEAGHKHGSSANDKLGTSTLAAAAGAGVGAAVAGTAYATSSGHPKDKNLDKDLQSEAYAAGYKQASPQTASSINPNAKDAIYGEGYTRGIHDQPSTQSYGTGTGVAQPSNLDSKFKEDLYQHGYAKGSTEAKQRDLKSGASLNQPRGTNHREAAIIGSAGLAGAAVGAVAGTGYGTSSTSSTKEQQQQQPIASDNKARSQPTTDESLVVEVIGIDDRDEALRAAKKASKKLDDRGVDLSSGKLVINANTKEIYKTDNINSTSSSPSTGVPSASNQRSVSGTTNSGDKIDTYQQAEAAKKRLAEAARKNVTSTHEHPSGSGLTAVETAALSAGVAGAAAGAGVGAATASAAGGQRNYGKEEYISGATKSRAVDESYPPETTSTEKHSYPGETSALNQPPAKKQETEAPQTGDDEIFVNVKGIKDNGLATKIARTAVARLQKSHAAVVAKVKELQVDATTGIVRDENGQEIAQYPDLAVDHIKRSGSQKSGKPHTSQPKEISSGDALAGATAAAAGAGAAGIGAGAAGFGTESVNQHHASKDLSSHPQSTVPPVSSSSSSSTTSGREGAYAGYENPSSSLGATNNTKKSSSDPTVSSIGSAGLSSSRNPDSPALQPNPVKGVNPNLASSSSGYGNYSLDSAVPTTLSERDTVPKDSKALERDYETSTTTPNTSGVKKSTVGGSSAGTATDADAEEADTSLFSFAETSTYSMPGSWN
ncbi:hypothetical protein G210_5424, partial [Candida maltosa Xu316]